MAADEDMFIWGLLVIAGGIAVAYISALFMAGFGELIESTTENKQINAKILYQIERSNGHSDQNPMPAPGYPVPPAPNTWICTRCGTTNSTNHAMCKTCGQYRTS